METRREFLARSASQAAVLAGLPRLATAPDGEGRGAALDLAQEAARVRLELRLFVDEYLPVLLAPRLLDYGSRPPHLVSWPGDRPALRPGPVADELLCRAALLPRWRAAVRRLALAVPSGPGAAPARPNGGELRDVLAATGPEEALLDEPERPCYGVVGGRIEWRVHPYHLWGPGDSEDQARRVLARVPFADAKAPDARQELLRQLPRVERWVLGLAPLSDENYRALPCLVPLLAAVDPAFAATALDRERMRSALRRAGKASTELDGPFFGGMLCCAIHATAAALANNHLPAIRVLVRLPEVYADGFWRDLGVQVLAAILYRKVMVLRRLAGVPDY